MAEWQNLFNKVYHNHYQNHKIESQLDDGNTFAALFPLRNLHHTPFKLNVLVQTTNGTYQCEFKILQVNNNHPNEFACVYTELKFSRELVRRGGLKLRRTMYFMYR